MNSLLSTSTINESSNNIEKWFSLNTSKSKYPYIDFVTPLALEALFALDNPTKLFKSPRIEELKEKSIIEKLTSPETVFKNSWITELETLFKNLKTETRQTLFNLLTTYKNSQEEAEKESLINQMLTLAQEQKIEPYIDSEKPIKELEAYLSSIKQKSYEYQEEIDVLCYQLAQLEEKKNFLNKQERVRINLIYDQTIVYYNKSILFFNKFPKPQEQIEKDKLELIYLEKKQKVALEIYENKQKLDTLSFKSKRTEKDREEIKQLRARNKELKEDKRRLKKEKADQITEIDQKKNEQFNKQFQLHANGLKEEKSTFIAKDSKNLQKMDPDIQKIFNNREKKSTCDIM